MFINSSAGWVVLVLLFRYAVVYLAEKLFQLKRAICYEFVGSASSEHKSVMVTSLSLPHFDIS